MTIRTTKGRLRKLINEEAMRLVERGLAADFGLDDTVNAKGSERKIQAGESPVWKKLKANAGMISTGVQRLNDAILDQDEAAAAHWLEEIQKYAKLGYAAVVSV